MNDEGTPDRAARARLPATVLLLGLTSFLTDVGTEMVFPLLPAFVAALGASPTFFGLVEGLADAVASLLKLAAGALVDRAPAKKPLVLVGYGLSALVRPLMALATAPWHVLGVRLADRVGKGIRSSPRDVLLASAVPASESGRAFGFHRAMDHAGAVVGPLVAAGLLASGLSVRSVFLCALVPGALSVVAVLALRERASPGGESAPQEGALPSETAAPSAPRLPTRLRVALGILGVFALGNSSDAFLLLRARELGVSLASLPLLWTALHVSKLASSALGGDLSDRVPRARLIVAGWLVYSVTYLGFGLATRPWHVWGLFVVYGTYYGLTEPAEKALVKDLAPVALRGRAYGLYHFLVGIAAVPAGVLTGALWQARGPLTALGAGAALAAVSAVAMMAWERGRPR
ncbi:MAG TPA: MFS transporter [Polyangiaceae bacterium]|nr:MFS transporter [Polyangiaceae bacterium]